MVKDSKDDKMTQEKTPVEKGIEYFNKEIERLQIQPFLIKLSVAKRKNEQSCEITAEAERRRCNKSFGYSHNKMNEQISQLKENIKKLQDILKNTAPLKDYKFLQKENEELGGEDDDKRS